MQKLGPERNVYKNVGSFPSVVDQTGPGRHPAYKRKTVTSQGTDRTELIAHMQRSRHKNLNMNLGQAILTRV
jgi:hypothetical protein